VTLIVDTGALLAHSDDASADHNDVVAAIDAERGDLVLSPFVAQEADHLLLSRHGVDVERAFLLDVASGAFTLAAFEARDVGAAEAVLARYRDLRLGLADASIVVLAERWRTTRLLTFDERHFRAVEPLQGGHFTILPADG
jgi:predicted nucleic acid-binding protein